MISITSSNVAGLQTAIHGMRNPMNSWDKSDSYIFKDTDRPKELQYILGKNDKKLAMKLAKNGPVHAKYRRMIAVWCDITAPLYWWKEFETYRAGVIPNPFDIGMNSCSTMHKICVKEFTRDDFSREHLENLFDYELEIRDMAPYIEFTTNTDRVTNYVLGPYDILDLTISMLNRCRDLYLKTKDKKYWWQMIQLLPSSYNQKRTLMLNYEALAHMYHDRQDHKLDEWRNFCKWIETLPYSELITLKEDNNEMEDK